jgi:hypothetical protein
MNPRWWARRGGGKELVEASVLLERRRPRHRESHGQKPELGRRQRRALLGVHQPLRRDGRRALRRLERELPRLLRRLRRLRRNEAAHGLHHRLDRLGAIRPTRASKGSAGSPECTTRRIDAVGTKYVTAARPREAAARSRRSPPTRGCQGCCCF